jgi:hypothetical protein
VFRECGMRSRPCGLRLSMVSTVGIKSQGTSGGGRRRGLSRPVSPSWTFLDGIWTTVAGDGGMD